MNQRTPRAQALHSRGQAGFSIIEGLVSMAVLLIVLIGVIPLFTQSMVNNLAGSHITQATNFATDGFEEVAEFDFESDRLTLADGSNALRIAELFGTGQSVGVPIEQRRFDLDETTETPLDTKAVLATFSVGARGAAEWMRVITVRQFPISATRDEQLDVDEQLGGDFPSNAVNLKLVEITVVSVQDGSLVGQGRTTASIIKVT
ncbi:MAG: hypothetical protein KDD11_18880 [Acidobacteria bacterium]|nr:hypothetical protein [Acidobacteriota bacterium]